MKRKLQLGMMLVAALALLARAQGEPAVVQIHADQTLHRLTPYLTGACIEDVNHEIYGGIYSQMIFGESFQEAALAAPFKGFTAYGGQWMPDDGGVKVGPGDGSKLVANDAKLANGEISVDVFFPQNDGGNAGLILNVTNSAVGADLFDGYEISLDVSGQLVLGEHRQNFEPIRQAACPVPLNQWIQLKVRMTNATMEVLVDGKTVTEFKDARHPLKAGSVGLRVWRQEARFRKLSWQDASGVRDFAFEPEAQSGADQISGMWHGVRQGGATGVCGIETNAPFVGTQSQRLTFTAGQGSIGIANEGLNHQGMAFVKDRPYEGHVWVQTAAPTPLAVALESQDGQAVYAEQSVEASGNGWQRLDFFLTPNATTSAGRFTVKLAQPGSVVLGYAFLQPGEWGRFKGLPVRRDVVEGLMDQGITVLRYGGSMVNHPDYRWKKMVGPRDRRPPDHGTWYEHSSNGWGIPDFLDLCAAAGFLGVPDFNINESPQDLVDFIEYANGPADSPWGRRRAEAGHPEPYHLKYLELGNEERVDDGYAAKFEALAQAIWARDPQIILVVGDFSYHRVIQDPMHFSGADSGITNLLGQARILKFAKEHNREVWFDIHVWTEGPKSDPTLAAALSYTDALDKLAEGAAHRVLVFELNANNHSQRRALGNAVAINAAQRDGRWPIVTSANGLQVDGQNDNGWNQGLLFLNPATVWLQPPGYVTRMIARNYEPLALKTEVTGDVPNLDVSATRSEDGRALVVQLVNTGKEALPVKLQLQGFVATRPLARVEELAGPLNSRNTAAAPDQCRTVYKYWKPEFTEGAATYSCPPYSFTVIRFE